VPQNTHILFLTKYARNGASSRYRTFQYLPWMEQAGLRCHVMPLFDEAYLEHHYQSGQGSARDILRAFLQRMANLANVRDFDLVVVEYELLPYFPALPERWLGWMGLPYVVDYDDALFHQYGQHRKWWVRRLLGRKIARVMHGAALVVAGNGYLADYARGVGAKRVEIIPTVIDTERYPAASTEVSPNRTFTIGWIGSPSTATYLQAIAPALAKVCEGGGACVQLIGSGPIDLPGVPVELLAWDESTEVSFLQKFDVGIMPLPDEPWTRGKCGLKLIQYMACGLPVVASPVGANCDIVEQNVNGFLAQTREEWVQALLTLMNMAGIGRRMGQSGRKKVEEQYALQVTGPKLAKLLRSVGKAG
jgi:glycosyltransferase involved in cell wall biosynthesis